MTNAPNPRFAFVRTLALAAFAAVMLSACATNRASTRLDTPDYSGLSQAQTQEAVVQLGARYKSNPRDIGAAIHFSAALRAASQPTQAVAVMEQTMSFAGDNATVRIAYAKALTANGQFQQALKCHRRHDRSDPSRLERPVGQGRDSRPDGAERAGTDALPPGAGDRAAGSLARSQSRAFLRHDQRSQPS